MGFCTYRSPFFSVMGFCTPTDLHFFIMTHKETQIHHPSANASGHTCARIRAVKGLFARLFSVLGRKCRDKARVFRRGRVVTSGRNWYPGEGASRFHRKQPSTLIRPLPLVFKRDVHRKRVCVPRHTYTYTQKQTAFSVPVTHNQKHTAVGFPTHTTTKKNRCFTYRGQRHRLNAEPLRRQTRVAS